MAYRWHGQPWPTAQNPRTQDTPPPSGTCRSGHEMTAANSRAQSNGASITWVCLMCQQARIERQKTAKKERES